MKELLKNEWIKIRYDRQLIFVLFAPAIYPWYWLLIQLIKKKQYFINNIDSGQNEIANSYLILFHQVYQVYIFLLLPFCIGLVISFYARDARSSREWNWLLAQPVTKLDIVKSKVITIIGLGVASSLIFFISTQLTLGVIFNLYPVLGEQIKAMSIWDSFLLVFSYQFIWIILSVPSMLFCYLIALRFKYAVLMNMLITMVMVISGYLSDVFAKITMFSYPVGHYMIFYSQLKRGLPTPTLSSIPILSVWLFLATIFTWGLLYIINKKIHYYEDK